jgi:hypothetical protein
MFFISKPLCTLEVTYLLTPAKAVFRENLKSCGIVVIQRRQKNYDFLNRVCFHVCSIGHNPNIVGLDKSLISGMPYSLQTLPLTKAVDGATEPLPRG